LKTYTTFSDPTPPQNPGQTNANETLPEMMQRFGDMFDREVEITDEK
jgi:hypothetical protein